MTVTYTTIPVSRYGELGMHEPGFYVYRLRTDDQFIYVGMVGSNGPRWPIDRMQDHMRMSSWWAAVTHIELAKCPDRAYAFHEEREQIEALQPPHNIRFTKRDPRRIPGVDSYAAPTEPPRARNTQEWEDCGRQLELLPRLQVDYGDTGKAYMHAAGAKSAPRVQESPGTGFIRVNANEVTACHSIPDGIATAHAAIAKGACLAELWVWAAERDTWTVHTRLITDAVKYNEANIACHPLTLVRAAP